jgi:probable rRNA maturation factor
MTVAVSISVSSPGWRRRGLKPAATARRAARAALAEDVGLPRGRWEISLLLADDATVRGLNARWRSRDQPTNVLAFAARERPAPSAPDATMPLGDVVLAYETMAAEARAQGKPLPHHLSHLVIHGVLHLLGFDHERPAEARRMERLEVSALARLGFADPYAPSQAGDRFAPQVAR